MAASEQFASGLITRSVSSRSVKMAGPAPGPGKVWLIMEWPSSAADEESLERMHETSLAA